jgi:hypothetical protein
MSRRATPFDLWRAGMQGWMLMAEAQAVIAMRMWGMAGLWNVTPSENSRMVSEKATALPQSALAASQAAMAGKRPDEVMTAAIRPLRRKTGANARRLTKRGPKR